MAHEKYDRLRWLLQHEEEEPPLWWVLEEWEQIWARSAPGTPIDLTPGGFPPRVELNMMSAGDPGRAVGFSIHENIGIGAFNPRGLARLSIDRNESQSIENVAYEPFETPFFDVEMTDNPVSPGTGITRTGSHQTIDNVQWTLHRQAFETSYNSLDRPPGVFQMSDLQNAMMQMRTQGLRPERVLVSPAMYSDILSSAQNEARVVTDPGSMALLSLFGGVELQPTELVAGGTARIIGDHFTGTMDLWAQRQEERED